MKWVLITMAGLIIIQLLISGCATIFKGDMSRVYIPDSTEILDSNNVSLLIKSGTDGKKFILLPSNQNHRILLKAGNRQTEYNIEPEFGYDWLILDYFTFFGIFVDWATGNWYGYPDIILSPPAGIKEAKRGLMPASLKDNETGTAGPAIPQQDTK